MCASNSKYHVQVNRTVVSVAVPRNFEKVGMYIRVAVQGWRANCDFQLIVDHKGMPHVTNLTCHRQSKECTPLMQHVSMQLQMHAHHCMGLLLH